VVLLWGRSLASWLLAIDEHGGHEDLRCSGRRSVIPYVHRTTELYCSSLYESEPFLFSTTLKSRLPEHYIAQGQAVTLRPEARQVAPRWLKPYTTARVIMVRSSK
jgi:hypothetical protein